MYVGVASSPDSMVTRVRALEDSGSQIAVAHKRIIDTVPDVEIVGSVRIRGVMGDAVKCDLVKLHVCFVDPYSNDTAITCRIPIKCAVSAIANDDLLLPVDIIERLRLLNTPNCHVSDTNDYFSNSTVDEPNESNYCEPIDNVVDNVQCDTTCCVPDVKVVTRSGRDTRGGVSQPVMSPVDEYINADCLTAPETNTELSGAAPSLPNSAVIPHWRPILNWQREGRD